MNESHTLQRLIVYFFFRVQKTSPLKTSLDLYCSTISVLSAFPTALKKSSRLLLSILSYRYSTLEDYLIYRSYS